MNLPGIPTTAELTAAGIALEDHLGAVLSAAIDRLLAGIARILDEREVAIGFPRKVPPA